MRKFKDAEWSITTAPLNNNAAANCNEAALAVLMDIRDEIKMSNQRLRELDRYAGWNQNLTTEIRGLRRDLKKRLKPRCHRAHTGGVA